MTTWAFLTTGNHSILGSFPCLPKPPGNSTRSGHAYHTTSMSLAQTKADGFYHLGTVIADTVWTVSLSQPMMAGPHTGRQLQPRPGGLTHACGSMTTAAATTLGMCVPPARRTARCAASAQAGRWRSPMATPCMLQHGVRAVATARGMATGASSLAPCCGSMHLEDGGA